MFRLLLLLPGCATHSELPLRAYQAGDRQPALDEQVLLAEQAGREQALHQLRLASMALGLEDPELAEAALRPAVLEMQDFTAEGEYRALVGRESTKTWKGEPYEKMGAFLTLGAVLQAKGDNGNARAMYKSAVLADAGTVEQRYRSDFIAPWLLMAHSYLGSGKPGPAGDALERAQDALWSQAMVEVLEQALPQAYGAEEELALQLLQLGIPAGATGSPRDPDRAIVGSISQAWAIYRMEKERPRKQRSPDLRGYPDQTWEELPRALESLAVRLTEARIDGRAFDEAQERSSLWQASLDQRPNLLLLIEAGEGPHKAREGDYGHLLVIREGGPARRPEVQVDGQPLPVLDLDSYSYQATTRGGRRVDAYLQGKAVYKDASYVSGWVAWEIADVLASGNETAQAIAAVFYVTGCVLMVSSVATMPQADIREWGMLPEELFLVSARLPAGEHALTVDGHTTSVQIPEQGQVMQLLPRLAR